MKNPKTSNLSIPPTFKDSKHLQQTQSPYTIRISHSHYKPKLESLILITNPNLQSFLIPHSHYKPKFTQNNNWNLSSSLSTGWLKVSSLFKSIAEMTKPLVVRFVKSSAMGLIWVWDGKRLRSAWSRFREMLWLVAGGSMAGDGTTQGQWQQSSVMESNPISPVSISPNLEKNFLNFLESVSNDVGFEELCLRRSCCTQLFNLGDLLNLELKFFKFLDP